MDTTDITASRPTVSRRTVVRSGLRLAYTVPLISASYSLAALDAAADDSRVSPDEAAKLVEGRNTPPVAVTGEGFEVEDTDGDGVETVTVDGSSSADPDGTIVSYVWTRGDDVVSREVVATVQLPVGTHRLTLTVTDDKGESASARIRIRVKQGPDQEAGPTEEPPPDQNQVEPTEETTPEPDQKSAELPPPPYEVEAKQKNLEIAITWKVEPSVQPPYHVYRTLDDGLKHTDEEIDKFDWLLIREEWEKLSYRDADVQVGVPYFYAVKSFDGVNESERSNIVAVTLQPVEEEPPVDTPTPEIIAEPPTATVEVVSDTPTPAEITEDTPTEAPPPPDEGTDGQATVESS